MSEPAFMIDERAPRISVLLPVYNGERYLAKAIDSILAQTFTDFELIAIDDGSTDGSRAILVEYERKDARLRVVSRENRGLVATLNEGLDLACGCWIARMDQDDIALPNRFARQLEWLDISGADIAGSWVRRFGTDDKRVVKLHQADAVIKTELMFSSAFVHPSVMMRTSLIRQLRYDPSCEKAEDYDLWVRAAEAGWKMTNVPEVLLLYRIHAKQISSRTAAQQLKVGQSIRLRYWQYISNFSSLESVNVEAVLQIFEPLPTSVDMDAVDQFFSSLLLHTHGEPRSIILSHMKRLYLGAAAGCPNIVSKWVSMDRKFGIGGGLDIRLRLYFFRVFRIRLNGVFFQFLKRIYIWKSSL